MFIFNLPFSVSLHVFSIESLIYLICSLRFLRVIDSLHLIYLIGGVYNSYEVNFDFSLTLTSFHNLYGCLMMYVKVKGELIKLIFIFHLYLLITIHDDFDSADPSSMRGACHMNSVK